MSRALYHLSYGTTAPEVSPTSCRCSTPRSELYPLLSRSFLEPSGSVGRGRGGFGRGGRRRAGRRCDEERALVRLRVAAEPRLFLVGGAIGDRLDVPLVTLVLRGEHRVLVPKVGGLRAESMAEVTLLHEGIADPYGDDGEDGEHHEMTHRKTAGADCAGCNQNFAVSHAGSCGVTTRRGADYINQIGRASCRERV